MYNKVSHFLYKQMLDYFDDIVGDTALHRIQLRNCILSLLEDLGNTRAYKEIDVLKTEIAK